VEGPPQRLCYTAPDAFGNRPTVTVVESGKNESALLFSAATGGVSGWQIHFALLRLGTGKYLDNLFLSDTTVSNENQHGFWSDPEISDAPIFLTAEFVWGPDESHYTQHRYIVSSYVRVRVDILEGRYYYYLADRYMTVRKYDLENADILAAEKAEIVTRLKRIRAEANVQTGAPR